MKKAKKTKLKKKKSWLSQGWARVKSISAFHGGTRLRSVRRQLVNKIVMVSAVGVVIGVGAFFWSGYPQIWFDKLGQSFITMTSRCGLRVEEIMVVGRTHAPTAKILAAIQLKRGDPILTRSVREIQNSLEELSWIRQAQVQRRLPNTLYINLEERQPIAIWQHQKVHYLIDGEGVVISSENVSNFKKLPLVVGGDAPLHVPEILRILDRFPEIRQQVTALVRVGGRRWNVQLREALEVKLPEIHPEEALARLNLLLQQNKIDPSEMATIDLRIDNQMIMRLSPAAAIRLNGEGNEA
jgi:cell division protein FtsQ